MPSNGVSDRSTQFMIQAVHNTVEAKAPGGRPTICHVIHALGVGGAEVLVDTMVRSLADRYRGIVAVLDEVGSIGERLRADGFVVEHLQRRPGIDHRCAKRLNQFATEHGASLFHAHQYTPFFQAMLSRGVSGRCPVVFTEHGRHFPDLPSWKRSIVNRILLKRHDRLIGVGNNVRNALIANEGLPANRVEVIYNGTQRPSLNASPDVTRSRIRQAFGFRETDFVVTQVARLHHLKDHQTALNAIAQTRRDIPNIKLLIVGEGNEKGAIEATIKESGLAECVTLAGNRNDVGDLLTASDAFLLSSISEGIPLTIIEAMFAGLPVVSTAVGGIPEMLTDGISGLLAPAGDDAALAQCLQRLATDRSLRMQLSENGRQSAEAQFSVERMLNRYAAVYEEVLQYV